MDRFDHVFQCVEVIDVIYLITCLGDQIGVHGDTVALQAVGDRNQLALFRGIVIRGCVQLAVDTGSGEIERFFLPFIRGILVIDHKQRGRILGLHLIAQRLKIGAALGRFYLHRYAGFFLILLCQRLQCFVQLGLEVQPIDRTLGCAEAAGGHRHDQHNTNQQGDYSFGTHFTYSYHKPSGKPRLARCGFSRSVHLIYHSKYNRNGR